MQYIMNKKNPSVVKKVESASDYVSMGEWKEVTEKDYKETNKKQGRKPQ